MAERQPNGQRESERGRRAPDYRMPGRAQPRFVEPAPAPLAEPDERSCGADRGQREAEKGIGDLDREAAKVAEVEIVIRRGRLLAECAVRKPCGALEIPRRVEHVVLAEDQPARMLADDLHVLA